MVSTIKNDTPLQIQMKPMKQDAGDRFEAHCGMVGRKEKQPPPTHQGEKVINSPATHGQASQQASQTNRRKQLLPQPRGKCNDPSYDLPKTDAAE